MSISRMASAEIAKRNQLVWRYWEWVRYAHVLVEGSTEEFSAPVIPPPYAHVVTPRCAPNAPIVPSQIRRIYMCLDSHRCPPHGPRPSMRIKVPTMRATGRSLKCKHELD